MADGDSVVDVSEYTSVLRRWWPVILGAVAVGAVLGFLVLRLQTRVFEASAKVEVRPLVIAGDSPDLDAARQINTDTERAIAQSQRVTERALALIEARDELGATDFDDPAVIEASNAIVIDPDVAREVSDQIEVTVNFDSNILVFTASGGKAERSRDLAQASAEAYLDYRRASGLANTEQARLQLVEREATLLAELETLAGDIAAAGDNEAAVQALTYGEIARTEELAGIGNKLANLGAISVDPGEILTDAGLPEAKSGLPAIAGPFSGGLLGLMMGLGLAFLLDRQDDRVRTASLELSGMGLPLLGSVPVGKGSFRGGSGSAIAEINSEAGEAYRRVQGSLLFNLDQADKSMVLIAGTNNPHSATTVAANLATAAARAGRRTLLVGADLRRPSLHARFDLDNDAGLSDVLSGQASLAKSIKTLDSVPNLQILTSGTQVADPARLLQGEAFGRLVASARSEFDLVVFEAPPVLQVADAVDLARLCEGAVLVIEPDRATRSGVADSVEQLRRVGADVLGTVVAETSRT